MKQQTEDITKKIQSNAMEIIKELKQNEDLARFSDELEEQNNF